MTPSRRRRLATSVAKMLTGCDAIDPSISSAMVQLARHGLEAARRSRSDQHSLSVDLDPLFRLTDTVRLPARRRDRSHTYLRRPLRLTRPRFHPDSVELAIADRIRPPTVAERIRRVLRPGRGGTDNAPITATVVLRTFAHIGWSDVDFRAQNLATLWDRLAQRGVFYPALPQLHEVGYGPLWIASAHGVLRGLAPSASKREIAQCTRLATFLVEQAGSEPHPTSMDRQTLEELKDAARTWPTPTMAAFDRYLEAIDTSSQSSDNGAEILV